MATIKRFEDSATWQAAIRLAVAVFRLTEAQSFRFKGDLVNQLRRAALSVSNNIAEGFERGSTAELISFLYIARGSTGEVRSMLRFATSLGEMPEEEARIGELVGECENVSRLLFKWLEALKNGDIAGQRRLTEETRRAYESGKTREDFDKWRAAYRAEAERQMRAGLYGKPDAPPLPSLLDFARRRENDGDGAIGEKPGKKANPDGTPAAGSAAGGETGGVPDAAGAGKSPKCPLCGREMVKRKARNGSEFWGCSGYPVCRGNRNARTG